MSAASGTTTNPTVEVSIPLEKLASHATSYASARGLQIEKRTDQGTSVYECAPISLLPNAYPREAFTRAQSLAVPFNLLVDRVSRDGAFLKDTLGGGVSETDPYTGKLLHLYMDVYMNPKKDNKFAQSADRLGIQRSDYMLNSKVNKAYELKQVELNTIASSFAGLAVNVAALHRHLVSRFQTQVKPFLVANKMAVVGGSDVVLAEQDCVPENPALSIIPEAIAVAHNRYKERFLGKAAGVVPVVLFVVQEGETNTVDQRMLEFGLWEQHQVPVVRMSLTKARTLLKRDETTGALHIQQPTSSGEDSCEEVTVVYYRAGYAPTDYPDGYDGAEWQARELMERSRATKCPSLGYHLAGTKKVQQELARPGTLERFFPAQEEQSLVENMRSAFAGLYSLGEDALKEDLDAVKDALTGHEGQYVLKPQREGGGYNFYGERLSRKLAENVKGNVGSGDIELGEKLAEFILMERLFPPRQNAVLLRSGNVEGIGESISELGCFGTVVVSSDGAVCHNKYGGFLLRTKFASVDEGGVASGFATLSSPFLC